MLNRNLNSIVLRFPGAIGLSVAIAVLIVCREAPCNTNRFALVLGNNSGMNHREKLQFAESDARRFHRVLTELGGFQQSHARLLVGADADQVWKVIYELERQMAQAEQRNGQRSLFIFYYSGHADGESLELQQTKLRFKNILEVLKRSSAHVRVALLDSCKSGNLVSMKTGDESRTRVRVVDQLSSKGYAIITSSAHDELSQESQEIRGAFFTHYLISALRGAADESNDGQVTLGEAYDYAYRRTLARTSQTMAGSQHPMYEFNLKGRGDVVLTYLTRSDGSMIKARLPEAGRLIVLDELGEQMMAEIEVVANQTAAISVPPGDYRVFLRTPDNATRAAEITVQTGATFGLGFEHFRTVQSFPSRVKQSLTDRVVPQVKRSWHHTLALGGQWQTLPLEEGLSSWGGQLSYRIRSPKGWQPTLALGWIGRRNIGITKQFNAAGVTGGLGYAWKLGSWRPRLEAVVGYETIWQVVKSNDLHYTASFSYGGQAGLERVLGPMIFGVEAGLGARVLQIRDQGWEHRAGAKILVSAGFHWE